ncbi:hypothetical protein BH09CHL1_BH09CHL1_29650 [soil metagenome]
MHSLPDYDAEMLEPRFVTVSKREWMATYWKFERLEQDFRDECRRNQSDALELWLRWLRHWEVAFESFASVKLVDVELASWNRRSELLGSAFATSKQALDAVMAGYYNNAYSLIRHLLETWRRSVWIRVDPAHALPAFELPTESPVGADGIPRKNRGDPDTKEIVAGITKHGEDEDRKILDAVWAGITHMHVGAHPGGESLVQTRGNEDHLRVLGPNYQRYPCMFALKWGLAANLWLFSEISRLGEQPLNWWQENAAIFELLAAWNVKYNKEFLKEPESSPPSNAETTASSSANGSK